LKIQLLNNISLVRSICKSKNPVRSNDDVIESMIDRVSICSDVLILILLKI
jgi:hypothetical protein